MLNRQGWLGDLVTGALLLAVYFVVGKLGLSVAYLNPSATPVWAPTGVALAAFLILGSRFWPVILAGAFLVNVTTAGSILTSIAIALGNTAEGLVGAYLTRRYADGRRAFERTRSVFLFVGLAAIASTMISATVGVTTLSVAGLAPWAGYGGIWLTWWLGDAVGAVIVTPAIVLWWNDRRLRWSRGQTVEAVLLAAALLGVGYVVFGGFEGQYPLAWLSIPIYTWAAFRFGPRKAASCVVVFSAIAVWGTLQGYGPFQVTSFNASLLHLQAFSGVTGATTLALAAAVAEARKAEQQLRELAVRDPLTGVANYRHFVQMLGAEITRAERTQRPFSLVMLDLDKLKKINDRHGHLVGSRVLCRLASALGESSRAMDTTARYGGDEFVLILPEASEDVAQQVAHRITEQVAADVEPPSYSVSFGLALYPRDGETPEQLVAAADRALYAAKAARRPSPAPRP